jgi:protein-S-isoprenylcysteine O-methyltransferase Ste14
MDKKRELLKAMVVLPGTALVLIPALILLWSGQIHWLCGKIFPESMFVVAVVFFLVSVGFSVALWTIMLFYTHGNGTPAPWAPPKHLVVRGPYAYVRNPMLMAVHVILLAEALLFGSVGILAWAAIFWALNTLYFSLIEEPGLTERFGDEYVDYAKHVSRWVPRLTAWKPTGKD